MSASPPVGGQRVAIYWTIAVDCGSDAMLAAGIAQHFDGFTVSPAVAPATDCKSHVETHRDIHFVCVHPRGIGNMTFPETERRPDLANDDCESAIRDILYAELHNLLGFRRAMFGAECFDQMAFATPDEDSDIDYGFMISSVADFPEPPRERQHRPFADGYRIVTAMNG